MILNVIIEPTDPIEMHQNWEKTFFASEGGMIPVEFSGNFRFDQDFEVEQQHRSSQFGNGRITKFKLHLVNEI